VVLYAPLTVGCKIHVALYPGLFAPVFVTCSTNMREGLVNSCDTPRHWVDMWRRGTFLEKMQLREYTCYQSQAQNIEQLSGQHQAVLVVFLRFRKLLTAVLKDVPLLHTSTQRPGTPVCHCM